MVVYLTYLTLVFAFQRSIIYPRSFAGSGQAPPPGVELLTVETETGVKVEAWLWPAASTQSGRANAAGNPLAVLFHGNAETISSMSSIAELYVSLGFAVLVPEYRGYGRSGGAPSQRSLTADAKVFIETVVKRETIDDDRVLLHGRSLGAGVACSVSREWPPAAMVLESPFVSLSSLSWRFGAPPLLVRDSYRNDLALSEFDGPVLLMHGSSDEVIPAEHSRTLAKLAKRSTHLEMAGGHNDFPVDEKRYKEAIFALVS